MSEYKVDYIDTEVDGYQVDLFECKELGIDIQISTTIITEGHIQDALFGFLEEHPLPLCKTGFQDYLEQFLEYEISKCVQIIPSTPA